MWFRRRTYLDWAAGMIPNPSSAHAEGRAAKAVLENARTKVARLLEVQADDVIFTSGATESNALAIIGHVRARRQEERSDTPGRNHLYMLYLPTAHASIVENAKMLAEEGVRVEPLPVQDGRVDTVALKKMLRKETALISMEAVCGETGIIWNTREVADVLRKHEASSGMRPYLHVDASQAPLTEKITRDHFGADLLTFDAAKVGRLRGAGILVVHRTIPLSPLYCGGGQERGVRPGTEDPERMERFAEALITVSRGREQFRKTAETQRTLLIQKLKDIPGITIQEGKTQTPNILNIAIPGRDTDYLVALLDEASFAVSTRSACETDSETGSRAVLALTGDPERARATLRISWGAKTSTRSLIRFARALIREVVFIDSTAQE